MTPVAALPGFFVHVMICFHLLKYFLSRNDLYSVCSYVFVCLIVTGYAEPLAGQK